MHHRRRNPWGRQRLILLLINVFGGVAVHRELHPGPSGESTADVLWGGVSEGVRPVYYVSMILSALSYFAFLYFLLVRVDPAKVVISGRFGYSVFYPIFLLILIPSAFWMPLSNLYVNDPGTVHDRSARGAGPRRTRLDRTGLGLADPEAQQPGRLLLGGGGGKLLLRFPYGHPGRHTLGDVVQRLTVAPARHRSSLEVLLPSFAKAPGVRQ